MDRIEVVRIIARLNVGGPALHTMHLTEGLSSAYPTLLVTGEVDEGEADISSRAVARGLRVHRIPELGRSVRPWSDLVALFKLIRLLRRVRPTIVHTHTAKAGTLGRIAALVCRVPVRVHTFHGHVFNGYFNRWKTNTYLIIERLLGRVTTRIITVSDGQADELVHRYRICSPDKMSVIPLGLQLECFAPSQSNGDREDFRAELGGEDEPVVTIVGRLAPIKNHDLFLDMAGALGARRRCRFVIVGGGSEEERLKQRASDLGLDSRISFLGWRSDLNRIYAGSDVVVLTSHNEGTPVCLIEALAAGKAIVSTDVGGVTDVLEGGKLGVLVAPGDCAALVEAVEALLNDPQRLSTMGKRGIDISPRRFGVPRLLHDVRLLYDELTASSHRPQGGTL